MFRILANQTVLTFFGVNYYLAILVRRTLSSDQKSKVSFISDKQGAIRKSFPEISSKNESSFESEKDGD